ncbi:hypothetical protein GCM10009720_18640 [Yaniella flava]|uniref:Uncharacterized protein n=1 Tax=Yaniella flava TaxID=287930 RepID=A0ABP5G3T1_9MICC
MIIEIEHGGTRYYPAFQFRNGQIINVLAEINQKLISRSVDCPQEKIAAALLDWWETPRSDLPKASDDSDNSPLSLLASVPEASFSKSIVEVSALESFVIPVME